MEYDFGIDSFYSSDDSYSSSGSYSSESKQKPNFKKDYTQFLKINHSNGGVIIERENSPEMIFLHKTASFSVSIEANRDGHRRDLVLYYNNEKHILFTDNSYYFKTERVKHKKEFSKFIFEKIVNASSIENS